MPKWPDWWDWELEFTSHLLKRMVDRSFTESDLRQMLEVASEFRHSTEPGRWVVETRHHGRGWEVVLEPLETEHLVLVVTAYPCE
jgi:hypothetical protein